MAPTRRQASASTTHSFQFGSCADTMAPRSMPAAWSPWAARSTALASADHVSRLRASTIAILLARSRAQRSRYTSRVSSRHQPAARIAAIRQGVSMVSMSAIAQGAYGPPSSKVNARRHAPCAGSARAILPGGGLGGARRGPLRSYHCVPPADGQRLASDEAGGGVGGQEEHGAHDVLGARHPAQRVGLGDAGAHLIGHPRPVLLGIPHAERSDLLVVGGHRHARAYHVEADTGLPGLARDRLAERDDAGLAGTVHALAELADPSRVGAEAHDGAALSRDHPVEHRARAVDHAPQVELDLLVPFLAGLLDEERVARPADELG